MNCWIVGAMIDGREDQSPRFLDEGYWESGWPPEMQPVQADPQNQMQVGDRIAIKRMLGKGSPDIEIRALGIIREVDQEKRRVYVDWLVRDLARQVPSRGCFATIHGPFVAEDPWVRKVFDI